MKGSPGGGKAAADRRLGGLQGEVARYWNRRIHDMEMTQAPPGTAAFFRDLEEYRFDKLRYLPRLVSFDAYNGRTVLEIGCGLGIDLARFAAAGAQVTGVDLAEKSIQLARQHFEIKGLSGSLEVGDGASLQFADGCFDLVYVHGVLQYAAQPERMVAEARRVLKAGGTAVFMVYNRISWLSALSRLTGVGLEHDDAPVFRTYSIAGFRRLLAPFAEVRVVPERFPVATRLHRGVRAVLYNGLFVGGFNLLPRFLVRRFGWHLMAFCQGQGDSKVV